MTDNRSDIVARLREVASWSHDDPDLCNEAADEIARLRAERETITKAVKNWLKRQANAERDLRPKAAFIEAHNAVEEIIRAASAPVPK